MKLVGVLEAADAVIEVSHVSVAEAFVELDFPLFGIEEEAFVEEFDGLFVSA